MDRLTKATTVITFSLLGIWFGFFNSMGKILAVEVYDYEIRRIVHNYAMTEKLKKKRIQLLWDIVERNKLPKAGMTYAIKNTQGVRYLIQSKTGEKRGKGYKINITGGKE